MEPNLSKCDKIIIGIMRNQANRAANCDAGNIKKQVQAANQQIAIIQQLQKNGVLTTLSAKLQETAFLRVQHPDATYEELAQMLQITKSGVVNRLRKIISLQKGLVSR